MAHTQANSTGPSGPFPTGKFLLGNQLAGAPALFGPASKRGSLFGRGAGPAAGPELYSPWAFLNGPPPGKALRSRNILPSGNYRRTAFPLWATLGLSSGRKTISGRSEAQTLGDILGAPLGLRAPRKSAPRGPRGKSTPGRETPFPRGSGGKRDKLPRENSPRGPTPKRRSAHNLRELPPGARARAQRSLRAETRGPRARGIPPATTHAKRRRATSLH